MTEEKEKWHLDKRVQISHITATVAAILAAVLYLGDIKKDVEILKVQTQSQSATQLLVDSRQDTQFNKAIDTLNANFDRTNSKLDRLIEKQK